VDDGFAAQHNYPPVQVGKGGKKAAAEPVAAINTTAATPPSAGDDGPDLLPALAVAAIAALAAGLGAAFLQRRRGGPSTADG
jgi:uncharacterized protein involved in exopolysaccharide biosynthesis